MVKRGLALLIAGKCRNICGVVLMNRFRLVFAAVEDVVERVGMRTQGQEITRNRPMSGAPALSNVRHPMTNEDSDGSSRTPSGDHVRPSGIRRQAFD